MILEMKVPSPGESITEVEIAEWLVQDGDYVEKDQAVAEVDSDKATLELPAEASGIITLKAEVGDAVDVGQVVCLIDTSADKPEGQSTVAKEILKEETEEGFQVLNSLDAAQLRKVIIDTIAYKDILTFDKRSADINSKLGLKYTELNENQQALLKQYQ